MSFLISVGSYVVSTTSSNLSSRRFDDCWLLSKTSFRGFQTQDDGQNLSGLFTQGQHAPFRRQPSPSVETVRAGRNGGNDVCEGTVIFHDIHIAVRGFSCSRSLSRRITKAFGADTLSVNGLTNGFGLLFRLMPGAGEVHSCSQGLETAPLQGSSLPPIRLLPPHAPS